MILRGQMTTEQRFVDTVSEFRVGDEVRVSVSWMERRTPKAGELQYEVTLRDEHLLYRNRHQVWQGFFATAAVKGDGSIELFARDTGFNPGSVLHFCEEVCSRLGVAMDSFDTKTYAGFALYHIILSINERKTRTTIQR